MTNGNSFRLFGACLLLSCAAHACGGTVIERKSPAERLTKDGAADCQAACKALSACPSKSSCDCSCECPADTPNCCDACTCHGQTVQECLKECNEAVAEETGNGGCEAELLGVLDCAASTDCSPNHCLSAARAFDDCRSGTNGTSTDVDPPSAGPAVVRCSSAGSGSDGQGGPGAIACDNTLTDCSDGHEYRVTCTTLEGGNVSCVCFVDGMNAGRFVTSGCELASSEAKEFCGWPLG